MSYDKTHNGPYDRGSADAYYGRAFSPHKYAGKEGSPMIRVKLTDPHEIEAYTAGYEQEDARKDFGYFPQTDNDRSVGDEDE